MSSESATSMSVDLTSADLFVGIDVSQKKLDVALVSEGKKARFKKFPNTAAGHVELLKWLTRDDGPAHQPRLHACLEATGTYGIAVATALFDAGYTVSVVNPVRIANFAKSQLRRTKNDRVDSLIIAEFCQKNAPAAWAPAAPELRQLQGLVRRLEHLEEMRIMETNRLTSGELTALVQQSIQEHVAYLEQQIKKTRQMIKDHIDGNPTLRDKAKLLRSIPGIGPGATATLLAEMGDMSQFSTARKAAGFAGLTPKERSSGSSLHVKPRLSKIGTPRVRKALYFPAMTALRYNPLVKAFGLRLAAKGKCKMSVIGAAMRKLLHIAYGVLKSNRPFDTALAA